MKILLLFLLLPICAVAQQPVLFGATEYSIGTVTKGDYIPKIEFNFRNIGTQPLRVHSCSIGSPVICNTFKPSYPERPNEKSWLGFAVDTNFVGALDVPIEVVFTNGTTFYPVTLRIKGLITDAPKKADFSPPYFAHTSYTIGNITDGREDVSVQFPYTYRGMHPIKEPVCTSPNPLIECSGSAWPFYEKSGQFGSVSLWFDDKFTGPVDDTLTVMFKNDTIPLFIKGHIHRDTTTKLLFDYTQLDMGTIKNGADTSFIFPFTNISNDTVYFYNATSNGVPTIQWPREIAPGEKKKIKISYDTKRTGDHKDQHVYIYTTTQKYTLTYSLNVLAPDK